MIFNLVICLLCRKVILVVFRSVMIMNDDDLVNLIFFVIYCMRYWSCIYMKEWFFVFNKFIFSDLLRERERKRREERERERIEYSVLGIMIV